MPYLLASMKCTRCIFMECRRNRSPRASASFCYRLHAARSSARQNFRSHGHGSALCQTADCFPPREHLRIDLGSRVPQKAPFLHIFWSSSDAPGDPPQPPQHGAGFWEQYPDKRLPLPTGGGRALESRRGSGGSGGGGDTHSTGPGSSGTTSGR